MSREEEMSDLSAALLRDVKRHYDANAERVMLEAEVLAALSRALDGVDERAGEVVRELREVAAVFTKDTVFTDAADLITALLAQNAALRAERDAVFGMYMRSSEEGFRQKARVEAAEAEVEKLRGALGDMIAVAEQDEWHKAMTGRQIILQNARAALTTEE